MGRQPDWLKCSQVWELACLRWFLGLGTYPLLWSWRLRVPPLRPACFNGAPKIKITSRARRPDSRPDRRFVRVPLVCGLARECGVSVNISITDPPHSRASRIVAPPLPQGNAASRSSKVTRRQGGTISRRDRSNGYVHTQKRELPKDSCPSQASPTVCSTYIHD
jgi:hypothetical protein